MKHAFKLGLNRITEKNKRAAILGSKLHLSKAVIRTGNNMPPKRYSSITEASKTENINHSDISQVCKGNRKTAGGFKWTYEKKELLINENVSRN